MVPEEIWFLGIRSVENIGWKAENRGNYAVLWHADLNFMIIPKYLSILGPR